MTNKRLFRNRWTDEVYTLPELHNKYKSENVHFTFAQWLDMQIEYNGGDLEELRPLYNASTKSINTLRKERIRLLTDFHITITPIVKNAINAAKSEMELERISHTLIMQKIKG